MIYDEADSIVIPNTFTPQANFIWFVTSSLQNLLFPSGTYFVRTLLPESNRTIVTRKYIDGIRKNGFIKETFRMIERHEANAILPYIILKNEDLYVQKSYTLPTPYKFIIQCRTPLYMRVVNGFVTPEIMQMLNAGNVDGAIEKTGVSVETCENIVQSITQRYEIQLNNTKLQYQCIESMEYARETDKQRRLDTLREEIERLNTIIESIKTRIQSYETTVCPICMDTPINPVTTNCCQNVFCFECMTRSLERRCVCPMCRGSMSAESLIAIGTQCVQNKVPQLPSKDEAFLKLLETYTNGKFLVFSGHDQSFRGIEESLCKNNQECIKLSNHET